MLSKIYRYLYERRRRVKSRPYGYLYLPNYNTKSKIMDNTSNLYNEHGERLHEFFIRDKHLRSYPYRVSRYFHFDRYNLQLKTHFYSHESMLETQGTPDRKFGFLIESPTVVPKSYRLFDTFKGLEKDFDLIFTYSDYLLNKLDNARFTPFCATLYNSEFAPNDSYLKKDKDISILSSNKLMCELHKFRYDLAYKCKNEKLADTFGTFDGGDLVSLTDTLLRYRYSICIENNIEPYFFTERIICAFANQTIPIYLGTTKINEFFNPDGIIQITTKSDIKKVLKECTKENYEARIPAILDNYERCKKFTEPFDYMWENHLKDLNIPYQDSPKILAR